MLSESGDEKSSQEPEAKVPKTRRTIDRDRLSSNRTIAAQCVEYVQQADVVLTKDYEVLPPVSFLRKKDSRREHPMNLNGNMNHLVRVRHIPTGTDIYYCYEARVVVVKRVLGQLKALLPDYIRTKLTGADQWWPQFRPFLNYLPPLSPGIRQEADQGQPGNLCLLLHFALQR